MIAPATLMLRLGALLTVVALLFASALTAEPIQHELNAPDYRLSPPRPPDWVMPKMPLQPQRSAAASMTHDQYLSIDVLVVVYTNYVFDNVTTSEIQALQAEVAQAREFDFRNSQCRLDLNISYEVINRNLTLNQFWKVAPPYGYWYPFWEVDGIHSVRNDLYALGYSDNQFAAVFVYYAWQNVDTAAAAYGGGAYGPDVGFMGNTAYASVPLCWDPATNDWYFIHEFHHQLDGMFNYSGHPEYPHADQPGDYNGGYDDGYSFNAWIMRSWPFNDWGGMSTSWGSVSTFDDPDTDSLPNSGTFPITETTFGSDPTSIDGDYDGLSDMGEATADYFKGSDPMEQDTDGDGLPDGLDRYALDSVKTRVPYANPIIDGVINCPNCSIAHIVGESSADLNATLYAGHNDSGLYIALQANDDIVQTPWGDPWWDDGFEIKLDATDDGYLNRGDNDYTISVAPTGGTTTPLVNWAILRSNGTRDQTYIPQTDVRAAYTRGSNSYSIEVFIKTNTLTGLGVSSLDTIGLQVDVIDYDTYPGWPHYVYFTKFLSLDFIAKDEAPPAPPQNLTANASTDSVVLAWNKNLELDISRYRIFGGVSPHPTSKVDSTTGGISDTTKVVHGLVAGTAFYFRIAAVDTAGNVSSYSNEVAVLMTCCVAATGNVDCDAADGVDIGDLTALIDNLFISFTPLCCEAEANCDGSGGIDIGDLTALIDNLFITFTPLAACQ